MGRHLFVCTNARASGKPACGPRGGDAVLRSVGKLVVERGLADVLVTPCGCLGACFDGPAAVLYPEGTWYGGLAPDDAVGLVDHLSGGPPLAARVMPRPGSADDLPAPPGIADDDGPPRGDQ